MNGLKISLLLAFVATLAACGGGGAVKEDSAADAEAVKVTPAETVPLEEAYTGHPLDNPDSLLSKRTLYFDFDSSYVKDEEQKIIEAHGNYLSQNPNAKIVLEGHCDERGSREYNVALGERRAKAVDRLIKLMGVAQKQVELVSYGEERPAKLGHDESTWALNRRVEIVYDQR